MTTATKAAAERYYRRATPLHGRNAGHKADLVEIADAKNPMTKAEKLVAQRKTEAIEGKVERMLREQRGRRKRYRYDQEAVIGIEHLIDGPMDPHSQLPIWQEMLRATKGTTMPKADFMRGARAILAQTSLYDPATMAG